MANKKESDDSAQLLQEPPEVNTTDEHDLPGQAAPYWVACIGASAGGLTPLSELLHALPPDSGLAYVIVTHLAADHPSQLAEILGRHTAMQVVEATDRLPIQRNHVYVIPPGVNMVISHVHLELAPRTEQHGQHRPIDHFMRSLAQEQGYKSIGVILSGTGNDGTLGLGELKAAGGITFAQDDSAEYSAMPRNAAASGHVDFVLPLENIAGEISRIGREAGALKNAVKAAAAERDAEYGGIFERLRQSTGVDFAQYKLNTVHRRIARRMVLHRLERLDEYVRLLDRDAREVHALYQDILINVTSFFRDPEAYEALKTLVFSRLVNGRVGDEPVRVWALGCSTGEEAYSIAMSYLEFAEASGCRVPMQIFATDLNAVGIDKARAGLYSKGIAQDVSAERLRRFFSDVDGSYRICKPIRDMCIFARQNSLADPPFSRIDLVSCRNMLIYLEPTLQRRLLPTLHYSLRENGFLWLGNSETIGSYRDLFDLAEPRHKIYRRRAAPAVLPQLRVGGATTSPITAAPPSAQAPAIASLADAQREADRMVIDKYAPPGLLVSAELEILQFRGDTGPFITPSPGRASLNLLKMLRDGLVVGVRTAVQRAQKEGVPVREFGLRVGSGDARRDVSVHVIPLKTSGQGRLLVLFEEAVQAAESRVRQAEAQVRIADDDRRRDELDTDVQRLEQELASTRDYLQSVIEQQEAANEELQSANEEVQSSNEELQSINEELETSKEETQSTNEELATVNNELQDRNSELGRTNNDLLNLLSSVQMAIVMLGPDLRIRRFTPAAERLLNLIPSDVGRPLGDIKLNVDVPELDTMLLEVVDTVTPRELEVRDRQRRWFLLRLRPYKTLENKIEGAVLVLIDIDALKSGQESLRRQAELLEQTHEPIFTTDLAGRISHWNRGAEETYGYSKNEAIGRHAHELLKSSIQTALVREALERDGVWSGEVSCARADGAQVIVESRMVRVTDADDARVLQTDRVITAHKQRERLLRERAEELVAMDDAKNQFLAVLSHELRNPLASLRASVDVLKRDQVPVEQAVTAMSILERQTGNMIAMVDDLLDIARFTRGHIELRREIVDLNAVIRSVIDTFGSQVDGERELSIQMPEAAIQVYGDRVRLEQIFGNLVNNALKFTSSGDRIAISIIQVPSGAASEAIVRIADNGIGIDREMLPRIFDVFVQADHSSDRHRSGLGLGLTLTRKLVELHGGSIGARSEGLGRGSEMIVRLPLLSVTGRDRSPPLTSAAMPADSQPLRILLVDDNVDATKMMEILLRMHGHEVLSVHDGVSALAAAREFLPEAVLLDIGMPDIDGYEVARQFRADPLLATIKLIAVTGYGQKDDLAEAGNAGFDAHVTKPADFDKLQALLMRFGARR